MPKWLQRVGPMFAVSACCPRLATGGSGAGLGREPNNKARRKLGRNRIGPVSPESRRPAPCSNGPARLWPTRRRLRVDLVRAWGQLGAGVRPAWSKFPAVFATIAWPRLGSAWDSLQTLGIDLGSVWGLWAREPRHGFCNDGACCSTLQASAFRPRTWNAAGANARSATRADA